MCIVRGRFVCFFFFFSSRRRHTRCREVSWARRCVQETGYQRRVHGDTPCLYKDDFRIYLTTTVANPHLSPRVFNHTSVLSFCVSKEAINDQLMHILANIVDYDTCLLYTSDAADDTPCVDLGGRRIIKKKKHNHKQN
eukprot:TRINITY_DN25787_c0_g1_i1.p1 TRINITY_DN25787_c0_g1~~TRINITY_DN25787_c0_g1_i1.p1  ORF type:complete len:138 (-),score=49.88 TRINITY_DN25787_c0_g1_i1:39-452(-)